MPAATPRPVGVVAALVGLLGLALTACSAPADDTAARTALDGSSAVSTSGGPGTAPATTTAPGAAPSAPSGSAGPSSGASVGATGTPSPLRASAPPLPSVTKRPGFNAPGRFTVAPVVRGRALAGRVVVVDPGHQLGNSRHRAKVNRKVNAGHGLRKACNTTGTSTNGGYPESRFTMRVALAVKKRLEAQGATVVLTRPREDRALWGPCIDVRGRSGNAVRADALVSIHADGAPSRDRGFHVIRPASVRGWTDDIAGPSKRLAVAVHTALLDAGERPAAYVGSRDGYDVRSDLGTLNWSDRPAVVLELGNMRNASDAAMLTDPQWQDGVAAAAITAGVVDFLS